MAHKVSGPSFLSISFNFCTMSQFVREFHHNTQFQRALTCHFGISYPEGMQGIFFVPYHSLLLKLPMTSGAEEASYPLPGVGIWAASASLREQLGVCQGSALLWAMGIWVHEFWPTWYRTALFMLF